jgi:hypothetical protein
MARIVWRAVTKMANVSAPAPRRMLSLRAWLTTRPGRPIRRKRRVLRDNQGENLRQSG